MVQPMTPPTLAWLQGFCHSLGGALDCSVTYGVEGTVNPLVYKVKVQFSEALNGQRLMLVWNLFQKYAAKNDVAPQGKTEGWGRELIFSVATKRRLGPARDEHPLE